MSPPTPPDFSRLADHDTKRAFVGDRPECVEWLAATTKLFKWTKSITNKKGISPWWQFLIARRLPTGAMCPGIQELQTYAGRLGIHDREYARTRAAVTLQWNKMTNAVAIELTQGAWGFVGKAAGQLRDEEEPGIYLIGGEYQVWVPGLTSNDFRKISLLPYLKPNSSFGAR